MVDSQLADADAALKAKAAAAAEDVPIISYSSPNTENSPEQHQLDRKKLAADQGTGNTVASSAAAG